MVDYDKWEKMALAVEAEEKAEEQRQRDERKNKYLQEQEKKRQAYIQQHGHEPPKPSCCGFADPDELKRQQKEREAAKRRKAKGGCGHKHGDGETCGSAHQHQPEELTLEEKNLKKIRAVYAAREDANRMFKEGDYETAFRVYERGILIINGMYGLSDEQYDEMMEIENALNLNIAAVKLKQKEFLAAIDQCKIVLNQKKDSAKAYYRMSQAYKELGALDKAKDSLEKAAEIAPNDTSIQKSLVVINQLLRDQDLKHKEELRLISENLKKLNRS